MNSDDFNNMNLANEINTIWSDNESIFEAKLNVWLEAFESNKKALALIKKQFHQWGNLRVYISTSKAKLCIFSLRFFGQEVAQLIPKDGEIVIRLSGHSKKNKEWFKGFELVDGYYGWHSDKGRYFRSYFKKLSQTSSNTPKVKSPEHRVESKFIVEMLKGSEKFGISGLKIKPVTISGLPLQIPVPISASGVVPEPGNGYIDILSRHKGEGSKDRLCVWELKKPGVYGHPATQAYIYAATLFKIFRHTKNGERWYQLFGFKRRMPKSIEIEAVAAVSPSQKDNFKKEFTELKKNSPFCIGNDYIRLYAAYYTEQPDTGLITFESNPFIENLCNS